MVMTQLRRVYREALVNGNDTAEACVQGGLGKW